MNKLLLIILAISIMACQGSKKSSSENNTIEPSDVIEDIEVVNRDVPIAMIYKTIADFYENIPVIMDDEKNEIISYPSPSDIYYNDKLSKPSKLKNGYLLDKRGINKNVVFLTYTYQDYSKMSNTPSMSDMKKHIKEKYPLVELINCGKRNQYKDEIKDLNELIEAGFPGCKRIELN